jgi:hypothetical protein
MFHLHRPCGFLRRCLYVMIHSSALLTSMTLRFDERFLGSSRDEGYGSTSKGAPQSPQRANRRRSETNSWGSGFAGCRGRHSGSGKDESSNELTTIPSSGPSRRASQTLRSTKAEVGRPMARRRSEVAPWLASKRGSHRSPRLSRHAKPRQPWHGAELESIISGVGGSRVIIIRVARRAASERVCGLDASSRRGRSRHVRVGEPPNRPRRHARFGRFAS